VNVVLVIDLCLSLFDVAIDDEIPLSAETEHDVHEMPMILEKTSRPTRALDGLLRAVF
jgi:hypothetical protein